MAYNSSVGTHTFTGLLGGFWYDPNGKAQILPTRRAAHAILKFTMAYWGLSRRAAMNFEIIQATSDTSHIKNI